MTRWLLEGAIPAGAIVGITDLDDPEPAELIARGFDVVMRLHGRGEMLDGPVLLSWHWREGLVPGHEPPAPIWIRREPGQGFGLVAA